MFIEKQRLRFNLDIILKKMQKLVINFENCYGIKEMKHTFDFSEKQSIAIYAPNGSMKTSFAKTFIDHSKGNPSSDLVFPSRQTVRDIKDEDDIEIPEDEIFVIKPYDKGFESQKTSKLLANAELKSRYDSIYNKIEEKKSELIKALKSTSGITTPDTEISQTFRGNSEDFLEALVELKKRVEEDPDFEFKNIKYKDLFNPKVDEFLEKNGEDIKTYIDKFYELTDKSIYFKKGGFSHNNASNISKSLEDNQFFDAEHLISFNTKDGPKPIGSRKELDILVNKEKQTIMTDPDLLKIFEKIDGVLEKNVNLRNFREILLMNQMILLELKNPLSFKQKIWISNLRENNDLYTSCINEYTLNLKELSEIIEKAKKEQERWKRVLEIFLKRFSVPFTLSVKDQQDVILKDKKPDLIFKFKSCPEEEELPINTDTLHEVLSTGEARALYILNIIFEIEGRREGNKKTIFIIDDIADSFDYKNKYAIVEYLKEISDEENFYQILLTHNFDFFRTVQSRLLDTYKWKNSFIIQRNHRTLFLSTAGSKNICNPFDKWRNELNQNITVLIAVIPFVRNLIEYKDGAKNQGYMTLTHLLHSKKEKSYSLDDGETIIKESSNINLGELEDILKSVLSNVDFGGFDKTDSVKKIIMDEADNLLIQDDPDEIILEIKIVLSIAARIKAEDYMFSKVTNKTSIRGSQTGKLFDRYKREFATSEEENIKILEQVNLMTPENIHLNSFMYEPILDMSNIHLKKLYSDISNLS